MADPVAQPQPAPHLALFFLLLFGAAGMVAAGFPYVAAILPFIAIATGLVTAAIALIEDRRALFRPTAPWRGINRKTALPMLAMGVAAPIAGMPLAAGLYVLNALAIETRMRLAWVALIGLATGWMAFLLGGDTLGLIQPFDRLWLWLAGALGI